MVNPQRFSFTEEYDTFGVRFYRSQLVFDVCPQS
jgi:hypothetical protein